MSRKSLPIKGTNPKFGDRTMAQHKEVMNVKEASQYLGISPDTLYKYVSMDRIPAFKLGNRWRFKKTILDEWMELKSKNFTSERSKV
jgi:excisionase family DNA binding protein